MTLVALLIAAAAGLANPFQSGTNAELNKQIHSPVWAGVVVYGSGLLGLLLLQLFFRQPVPDQGRLASTPTWAWVGGLISILPTLAGLMFAQRLGAGIFTGVSVTTALVCSILLDHFGVVGFHQHSVSPIRLAGCGLMIAGLWMIART
jgi:transporter family-2 protein